jgi:hydrogenase nickel incorporation protein HypB
MCSTCGCGQPDDAVTIRKPDGREFEFMGNFKPAVLVAHHHEHGHAHPHGAEGSASGQGPDLLMLERDVLQKNNLLAERNRGYFEARRITAFNLMSSPGSGKTTLLEATIRKLVDHVPVCVIEGDQQTMRDADRIAALGVEVVQVNTGKGCHLDSDMVHRALHELDPREGTCLFIENVGNLVCPALFDLGENLRVVIMSVTEGDDKPLKYPHMFHSADVCVINKTDLLPYVDFDPEKAREYALRANHHLAFFSLSARTGEGLDAWTEWIRSRMAGHGASK